ncbi:MAG: peptide deformylase, partial [Candidatus Aminicenantes bacterium]|nr:peptide deformylase [Candidatus Aminicenantes bacterium]
KYGDEVLRKKASEIKEINGEIVELSREMVETMHEAPGIGLAAPQIGESIRLITVDLSVGEDPKELIVMINPEIKEKEGEEIGEEGCLSLPGVVDNVKRPYRILVKGYDLNGKEREIEAEGLLARVFCHEVDHLDGVLFIDRLSPLKKRIAIKKLKKTLNLS